MSAAKSRRRKKQFPVVIKKSHVAVLPRNDKDEITVAVITWNSDTVTDTDALMRVIRETLLHLQEHYEPVASSLYASAEEGYEFNIGDFVLLLPDDRIRKELKKRGVTNTTFETYTDDPHSHRFDNRLV